MAREATHPPEGTPSTLHSGVGRHAMHPVTVEMHLPRAANVRFRRVSAPTRSLPHVQSAVFHSGTMYGGCAELASQTIDSTARNTDRPVLDYFFFFFTLA